MTSLQCVAAFKDNQFESVAVSEIKKKSEKIVQIQIVALQKIISQYER